MEISRRHVLRVPAGVAALAASARRAGAQSYPARPITMIVPFPAGGATDTLARLLAEPLRASLGQPIIIENVAGAAGSIGVGRAARSAPDGYTLSIGTLTTHALIGGLYALQFDLVADFEPIAELASEPLLIVGRKNLPAADLKELIAWLKANPDTASVGIAGVGAVGQLTGISFQRETGTRFHFVPYRGNGPAAQDLVAGQIDLMIEPSSNFRALVRAGSVKAFAVTSAKRSATAPRDSDRGGGGPARLSHVAVVRLVGAQGHAEGGGRPAQQRGRRGPRRPVGAEAPHRARARDRRARPADAGSARRVAARRHREMVADHQGRQHQRRVMRRPTPPSSPGLTRRSR